LRVVILLTQTNLCRGMGVRGSSELGRICCKLGRAAARLGPQGGHDPIRGGCGPQLSGWLQRRQRE
jgi:hypothetical protein